MFKLFAKKSLGQNFLINEGVIARIVQAAQLGPEETALEVGPGTGNLTRALAASGAIIIAVEKDHRAIEVLSQEIPSVTVIEGDILELPFTTLNLPSQYKVVANLPYYITSHFIRTMLEDWPAPILAVLMVQKEVAQRMVAKPPEMNLLALSVQYYCNVEIVMVVSRGSFRPMPNVDSAVIKLMPKPQPIDQSQKENLFRLAKAAFAGKRKQLITTLPSALNKTREETEQLLKQASIDPMARPETLSLDDWLNLIGRL